MMLCNFYLRNDEKRKDQRGRGKRKAEKACRASKVYSLEPNHPLHKEKKM